MERQDRGGINADKRGKVKVDQREPLECLDRVREESEEVKTFAGKTISRWQPRFVKPEVGRRVRRWNKRKRVMHPRKGSTLTHRVKAVAKDLFAKEKTLVVVLPVASGRHGSLKETQPL